MQGGELIILNLPTTDFPTQMYVYCDTLPGYLGNDGDPTHIIGIFRIRELIPCVVGSTITYTIIYALMDNVVWDLGLSRHLAIKFGDETGAYRAPLAEPVSLECKLIHVAYWYHRPYTVIPFLVYEITQLARVKAYNVWSLGYVFVLHVSSIT